MREPITNLEQLRKLMGHPHALTKQKIYDRLFPDAVDFIAKAPLMFMATSNSSGGVTVSPKGDAAGFVQVADDQRLWIPERPGNKLLHGLSNIVQTGQISLIFIVPGTGETLRINGRASLFEDDTLSASMAANGKNALLIIEVLVEECFFHCAKAFKRSQTWKPESWEEPLKMSFGKQIAEKTGKGRIASKAIEVAVDQAVKQDYKFNL